MKEALKRQLYVLFPIFLTYYLLFATFSRRRFLQLGASGLAGLVGTDWLKREFPQHNLNLPEAQKQPPVDIEKVVKQGFTIMGDTIRSQKSSTSNINPIVIENLKAGTHLWRLTNIASDATMQIKGYASATSVNKGGSVDLFVTVNPPQKYTITLYRIGWYGGVGGRKVIPTIGPLDGITQTMPEPDPVTGMVECRWSKSYRLNVPTELVSGQYLLKLVNSAGFDSYIHLVVRDDFSNADLLFQSSVTTYQAYSPFGGKSLYGFNSTNFTPAVKVSFDRPYANSGCGDFLYWELSMIRFLEKNGLNVSYCSNLDIHTNPNILNSHKGFLSVGHDEYWSRQMYSNVLAARDKGLHLGFFGGNEVYWQVRFEESTWGAPNRVMVGYKEKASSDPAYRKDKSAATGLFSDSSTVNRPENQLTGTLSNGQNAWDRGFSYKVTNSDHWVYAGTGFEEGSTVEGIVGYEWNRVANNGFSPPGLVELSASTVNDIKSGNSIANSTIYQAPSGAWVFNAGTIYWVYGCEFTSFQVRNLVDKRIQQTTMNILNKFTGQTKFFESSPGTPVDTPALGYETNPLTVPGDGADTFNRSNIGNFLNIQGSWNCYAQIVSGQDATKSYQWSVKITQQQYDGTFSGTYEAPGKPGETGQANSLQGVMYPNGSVRILLNNFDLQGQFPYSYLGSGTFKVKSTGAEGTWLLNNRR
jgi:hypothetical protein